MESPKQKLRIVKLIQVTDALISQLNMLLDEGTVWDKEQGEAFLENPDNCLIVAYWEEAMVGFVTGYRLQRFDAKKAEVLLYEIGVDETFRKRGIGKALIQAIKTWAKEVGADEIWVVTNKSNIAAVGLYQSSGGVVESTDEQMFVIKI